MPPFPSPRVLQTILARTGKAPQQGDGYQSPEDSNPTPIQNSPKLKPRVSPNVQLRKPLRGGGQSGRSTSDDGVGTKATGFVTAAELPPADRLCGRCVFMRGGSCHNKNVMADPDVPDRTMRLQPDGSIRVAPDECCNLVQSARQSISSRTQLDRARPGTVGGTNPGSQPAGEDSNGRLQPGRLPLRSPGSLS